MGWMGGWMGWMGGWMDGQTDGRTVRELTQESGGEPGIRIAWWKPKEERISANRRRLVDRPQCHIH